MRAVWRFCVCVALAHQGGSHLSRYRYPLLVFLGGACYGILSTIVKLAYAAGIDRSGVSSGQFFFGGLLLLIPAWRARPRQLTARQVLVMLAAGVPTGGTTLFYYHALVSVSASLAVVLLFQYIVIALVLEAILRRAWPARQKLAALVLLLPGSLLASGVLTGAPVTADARGVVLGLLAALSYAVVLLVSGTVARDVPPVCKAAVMACGGAAVVFTVLPPTFLASADAFLAVLPYGLPLGLLGVTLPPLLFAIGIPHTGLGLAGILTTSELVIAMLSAHFVLGEAVSPLAWLGIALIFGGILVGNRVPAPRKKSHADLHEACEMRYN